MTVAAFAVVLAAVAVMVIVHFRTQRQLAARVERREAALDKQAKVFVRKLEATRRAAAKMVDECRKAQEQAEHVREDTRALQQSIGTVLADRRVQRLLDHEGGD